MSLPRINPLKNDALTADTVVADQRIIVWKPGDEASTRRYTVLTTPYTDDEQDMVVEVRSEDGRELVLLTSEAGLTGGRFDGAWTHIAIENDQEDD